MRKLTILAVAAAMLTLMLLGSGVSQAGHDTTHGDLLLDSEFTDGGVNDPTTVGTVTRELCNITAGETVSIDVIAVGAEDWAGMDFTIHFPSPSLMGAPGPGDGIEDGAFDYVTFSGGDPFATALAQNFLFPFTILDNGPDNTPGTFDDIRDSDSDYSTTEGVTDGSNPHGVSMVDNSLVGNPLGGASDSGALARISLDTSGMSTGQHTLILSISSAFAGGIHSDAEPFLPDSFGAFKLAIGAAEACDLDSDDDGVSDADEIAFGSSEFDANEIPENAGWLPEFNGPTCTDGIDNDRDGLADGKDFDCPAPDLVPFEVTMDFAETECLPASLEIDAALDLDTAWHELFPTFSDTHTVTAIFDTDGDGIVSAGDTLEMTPLSPSGDPAFFLVDDVTLTIFLTEVDNGGGPTSTRELLGAGGDSAVMQDVIDDPEGSWWHEIEPTFSDIWHLSSFTDTGDPGLSVSDTIGMTNTDGTVKTYDVDGICIDILLTGVAGPPIATCGPGVDPSTGLINEPPSDGSSGLCHYSSTIDSIGNDGIPDTCVVGLGCTMNIVNSVDLDPPTADPPAPGAPLNPAVTILTGPTFDFAADADVVDGDVVGEITVEIRSDEGTPPCSTDLVSGPKPLLDGTIDTSTTTSSTADLFDPLVWPEQLDAEKAAVEAPFSGKATLHSRFVTVFEIDGTDIPLNILHFKVDPAFGVLVSGEGNGGWVTASFTGDPIAEGSPVTPLPATGIAFCTPFIADTTVLGDSAGSVALGIPGGSRLRTCLEPGTRITIADIDPDALDGSGADVGTRMDASECMPNLGHDVRVVKLNTPASDIFMKPGDDVSKAITVSVQNQSPHPETFRLQIDVTNPDPDNCTVNDLGGVSTTTFTTNVSLGAATGQSGGPKETFSGPQTALTFNCSEVTDDAVFGVTVQVDHAGDDLPIPQLDDDDIDPADNIVTKTIVVKEF